MPEREPRALTEVEQEAFEFIRASKHVALVQCWFDGEATAVISYVSEDDDDHVTIVPMAVLITPEMFNRITPPDTDVEIVVKQ
jgi:hypothetical protein